MQLFFPPWDCVYVCYKCETGWWGFETLLDAAVGRTRADHNPLGGRAASEVDHHGRSRASLGGTNWRDFSTGLLGLFKRFPIFSNPVTQ